MTTWIGIDVSMETLDFGWIDEGQKTHEQVPNNQEGFRKLLARCPKDAQFVMEATGTYFFNVALFLHQAGQKVSVVNPARIKHHMRADLSRNKSDKSDSFSIAKFGQEKNPDLWTPPAREVSEIHQLLALDDRLGHQITQLKNLEHAFSQTVHYSPDALLRTKHLIKDLKKVRDLNMKDLERMASSIFAREIEIISSIPGVGRATAIRVAASVGDFHRFETSRKLVSYVGLSPMLKQSGTSVKSRGHISRMGGAKIRGALYMCAMNALQKNWQCQQMWKRMKEKKKHGKVIMVAIMSKLIRQIHSMVVHDQLYDPSFR